MKTKNYYIKPVIEVINLEVKNNILAGSNGKAEIDISENPTDGIGRSRRRNFWGREEE